jgi:hypothetical protein
MDVELGTIASPAQVAVRRMSRNLDAIEEVRGSDSSISTFLDGVGGGSRERVDEVDGVVGSLRSDGTIDMGSGGSKEDLIEEMHIAVSSSIAFSFPSICHTNRCRHSHLFRVLV